MRNSSINESGSLITQTAYLKFPRLTNTTVKTISQQNTISSKKKKDIFFIRPEMKKILYSPLEEKNKTQTNKMLLESCLQNRSYHDIAQKKLDEKIQLYFNSTENEDVTLEKRSSRLFKNKILIGKQAPMNYYKDYKKLTQLIEQSKANKENYKESPYLAILDKAQKKDLLPMCLGLVKYKGDASILNISKYNLGDKYIQAMSAGLKQAKFIEKCFVSYNRITNKGMDQLVSNLNQEITVLDVSYNKISQLNNRLMQLIVSPQSRLENLNLQKNQIHEKENIQMLLNNVMFSKHMKVLNLRGNGIKIDCLDKIIELIQCQSVLEQLYIGLNYLGGKGSEKVFEALAKNKNIKVFDYSFNQLGQDQNNMCAKSVSSFLIKNKTLHHLDLSCNNFNQQGSKIISEGLSSNHTVYGIHFNGNYGYIDSRGFLTIQQKQMTSLHSFVESKINSYDICYKRKNISMAPQQFKNVCWVCQGWYEQQFRFTIPQDFNQECKFVYLHFDFELFAPRLINITDKNVKYTTMVPPKKFQYFFTFDNKQFLDKNNPKSTKLEFPQTFTYQMYHQSCSFKVQKVCEKKGKPKKIVNDWNQITIKTLPRNTGLVSKKQKQIWTYQKSAWAKQWKLQNQDLLKKCFQRDWKCTKLMNLVKNQTDQDKVKEKLCLNYKSIKLIYRYFSSWSPFGDIWAVSNNSWTEFCQQAKIINKQTPLKITDLTFITTNSMSGADWKGNQLVPQRGLIRFQFMQALVRLAQEKYKKNGLTDNFTDSINLLLKQHVLPLACTLHFQIWRTQKYFIQENDILIKRFRPIFSYIYKKNSKVKVKPGQKPFMCLTEFKSIMQKANVAGNYIIERDIFVSYNESMMTQIDEIENERFMKMSEIQFIEATARCSQLLPKSCTKSVNSQNSDLMHYKFEWLINQLKETQCNEDIKSQFPQTTSVFDEIQDQ